MILFLAASGKMVDASQEMMTLGLCNIFGSFVQSMPTCGAFTRSAVSNASGVRTPLAGLYSGKNVFFFGLRTLKFIYSSCFVIFRNFNHLSPHVFNPIFLLHPQSDLGSSSNQCSHLHDRLSHHNAFMAN